MVQIHGCPRNCERKTAAQTPLGNWEGRPFVSTPRAPSAPLETPLRKPGDLPSSIIVGNHTERGFP